MSQPTRPAPMECPRCGEISAFPQDTGMIECSECGCEFQFSSVVAVGVDACLAALDSIE